MLIQAAAFLITTFSDLFALALLLRFLLHWQRVAGGQLAQFLAALTDWVVRPAQRLVPTRGQFDVASLLLAWLTELLELWLLLQLGGRALAPAVGVAVVALAALALLQLVRIAIYIAMAALIAQAVLSWLNPYSPFAPLLDSMTRPLLRPFRRLLPPVANVDLSPLFALVVAELLLILPVAWLELALGRLLP